MDAWDVICEEREKISMIHQLLDTQEFVFYFRFDNSVFGSPEESRIMYAKMKHPDKNDAGDWMDEANFMAMNLDDILMGQGSQRVFSKKDIKKIKVIDKEEAAEELGKKEDKK
jgi:hypothetical protein